MLQAAADDVRRQLDHILHSRRFMHAGRMRRFLRFVVEQALAGREDRLKEYVIGIEVFDRGSDFDPRVDSLVRVEAGRLRTKLDAYYRDEGADAPVIITMPRGSYAPVIALRELGDAGPGPPHDAVPAPRGDELETGASRPAAAPTPGNRVVAAVLGLTLVTGALVVALALQLAPTRTHQAPPTTIAVLPFTTHTQAPSEAALALRLTEGVTAALVRRGDLAVISSTTARQFEHARGRLRDVAEELAADILVEARVLADEDVIRVDVRAVAGEPEQKFWVDTFTGTWTGTAADLSELERHIADAVAAASSARR